MTPRLDRQALMAANKPDIEVSYVGKTDCYSYDRSGNLLSDGNATYAYDGFGRTIEIRTADGSTQINRYDAEGLRAEMEENGELVKFLFNEEKEVIAEETNSEVIRYIRGLGIISSDSESARTYYHYVSDNQGSVRLILTDTTNDRKIRNYYYYDAFGESIISHEDIHNRFRFNGEQYDPVTSQYYLRARYYNPVIGRFTQEDTYYGDGLNLYEYCRNNPVLYRDPSGHDVENQKSLYRDERGIYSVGDAAFMDSDDAFVTNISRRKDVDPNGYYDVIAHGTSHSIQITHNGQHININHRVAARLIQNSYGYNGQTIRLLSCNTGFLDNGFAQNLANKLNVKVYAPTNYLWSIPNGKYFVAGMNSSGMPDFKDGGIFKLFTPGGN